MWSLLSLRAVSVLLVNRQGSGRSPTLWFKGGRIESGSTLGESGN